MKVYRITKKKYASDISGKGAEIFGGRWNPVGRAALYTSENRALSILELLVHMPKEIAPADYVIFTLEIPVKLEKKIMSVADLPPYWDSLQTNEVTQEIGLRYFSDYDAIGIIVPSTIVKLESNIVLNPRHKNYKEIKVYDTLDFQLDERLLK